MTRADLRLLCAGVIALAVVASAWAPPAPPLARIPLGLLMALFLPGYAWLRAAAPDRQGSAESLVLAVGLSLAICVVAGLALNALGRLDPQGWTVGLGGFTILCCAVAAFRRAAPARVRPAPRVSAPHAAMFALAIGMAAFGVHYAAVALEAHREFKFTQFWMTPRSEADRSLVTIGVRNEEDRLMTYAVTLVSDGSELDRWPSIDVAPGKTWTADFAISGDLRMHRVEAWLRSADTPTEVYRKVWIAPVSPTDTR